MKDGKRLSRRDKVLSALDRSGAGLEIGPSFNPLAPKIEGFDVEIIDHLDRDGLIEKYGKLDCDTSRIEVVDYVWHGESYADLTGKTDHYDWIIASHVIEHTPDLVGFLQNCASVLAQNGSLSLVVPDQRYCFDAMRPFSGIASVVDAHLTQRIRPTVGVLIETELNMVTRGGEFTWNKREEGAFALMNPGATALATLERLRSSEEYNDTHVWCFTPSSFRLLMHDLRTLNLIDLQEVEFFPTSGCEFFVTLKKSSENVAVDRLSLLESSYQELRDQPTRLSQLTRRVKRKLKSMRK